jgi:hypothetical protein
VPEITPEPQRRGDVLDDQRAGEDDQYPGERAFGDLLRPDIEIPDRPVR